MAIHESPGPSQQSPYCTQTQTPNIIWVQKGEHINSISYVPFPQPPSSDSQNSRKMKPPPGSPTGALMERERERVAVSRALLGISFMVATKGVLPPYSPHKAPTERYAVSRALFHLSFKVPGI